MACSVPGEAEFSSVTLMLFANSQPGRIGWVSTCGAREINGLTLAYISCHSRDHDATQSAGSGFAFIQPRYDRPGRVDRDQRPVRAMARTPGGSQILPCPRSAARENARDAARARVP